MINDVAIHDIKVEDDEVCELTVRHSERISDPDLDSMEPTNLSTKDRPSEERSESRKGHKGTTKRKKFEWQDEPTVALIEFIKTHPSIWDSTDLMYRNVRMNKNLFLDLVQLLSSKYPEHGYTYEIVRRKWDSLKGYFLRQAQKNADKPNGSTTEVVEDASDAVHWAYYDRLKFLSASLRIDDDEEREEENATPQQLSIQQKSSDLSNGNVKSHSGKKRKVDNSHQANNTEQQQQPELLPPQQYQHNNETDHPAPPPVASHLSSSAHLLDPDSERSLPRDPDEYGIGKYVGKTIQGLDEDLVDELVSQIVRDCLEVRHKQRLRHIEYYNRHNSLTN